jgi:hypothetical protein
MSTFPNGIELACNVAKSISAASIGYRIIAGLSTSRSECEKKSAK